MESFLSGVTAAIDRLTPSSPGPSRPPFAASIIANALAVFAGKFPKPPPALLDLKVYVFDI